MLTYEQLGELFSALETSVTGGFSDTSGWRYAQAMANIVLEEVSRRVQAAQFMGFSLDESTDNGGVPTSMMVSALHPSTKFCAY